MVRSFILSHLGTDVTLLFSMKVNLSTSIQNAASKQQLLKRKEGREGKGRFTKLIIKCLLPLYDFVSNGVQ